MNYKIKRNGVIPMQKGQAVKVVWGMFEGQEGFITSISGKNVIIMLTSKGYEIDLSTDHIQIIDGRSVLNGFVFEMIGVSKVSKKVIYQVAKLGKFYGVHAKSEKTGYTAPSKCRFFLTEQDAIENLTTT